MSDFFERNKRYYNIKKTNECNNSFDSHDNCLLDGEEGGMPIIENPADRNVLTIISHGHNYAYDASNNFRWEHVELNVNNEIHTAKYRSKCEDKLIKAGYYHIKGDHEIPLSHQARIDYYETEDRIILEWDYCHSNGEIYDSISYFLSFKNRELNISIKNREGNIRNIENLPINFFESCNANFFGRVMTGINSIRNRYEFNWNNGVEVILKHLGDSLIRKAYECGCIDKKTFESFKRVFSRVLEEMYSFRSRLSLSIEGFVCYSPNELYLVPLIFHLRYKSYLCLLENLKTNEEIDNYWIHTITKISRYNAMDLSSKFGSFFKLLRDTYEVDEVIEKITGFESKGKLKGKMLSHIKDCSTNYLYDLELFKGYYSRDWLLEIEREDVESYNFNTRSRNLTSEEKVEFLRNYCVSDKYKRKFFKKYFSGEVNDLVHVIKMYDSCPVDYRPNEETFNRLHDRLCDILNKMQPIEETNTGINTEGMFGRLSFPIIGRLVEPTFSVDELRGRDIFGRSIQKLSLKDSYEYNYELNCYREVVKRLDGEKVSGYDLFIPKKAIDIREGGRKLNNCLGIYDIKVAEGKTLILYLEKEGVLKYAIEIIFNEGENRFKVDQFYGERNSMPLEEDFKFFQDYLREALSFCKYVGVEDILRPERPKSGKRKKVKGLLA